MKADKVKQERINQVLQQQKQVLQRLQYQRVVTPVISQPQNQHVAVPQRQTPHLAGLRQAYRPIKPASANLRNDIEGRSNATMRQGNVLLGGIGRQLGKIKQDIVENDLRRGEKLNRDARRILMENQGVKQRLEQARRDVVVQQQKAREQQLRLNQKVQNANAIMFGGISPDANALLEQLESEVSFMDGKEIKQRPTTPEELLQKEETKLRVEKQELLDDTKKTFSLVGDYLKTLPSDVEERVHSVVAPFLFFGVSPTAKTPQQVLVELKKGYFYSRLDEGEKPIADTICQVVETVNYTHNLQKRYYESSGATQKLLKQSLNAYKQSVKQNIQTLDYLIKRSRGGGGKVSPQAQQQPQPQRQMVACLA
ncbi:MAG: hypothetical protein LBH46_02990 [Rickettsiales bacterium]|nr:hypothetical protein [Rickettsiales bacterium]